MAGGKIADFFAQIGIKVDEKSLKRLDKSFADLERGLHNLEASAKKSGKALSDKVPFAQKNIAKSTKAANKELIQQEAEFKRLGKAAVRYMELKKRAVSRDKYLTRIREQGASLGGAYRLKSGFGRLSQVEAQARTVAAAKEMRLSLERAQADSMFAKAEKVRQTNLKKVQEEYARTMSKAAKDQEKAASKAANQARIQENSEKRIQAIVQRTAAIREAGAARAAAIIKSAEMKAQAMAARTAHKVGRPAAGVSMGAGLGGAVGAASQNIAGILPGFGAAYAAVNFNQIGQELTALQNSLLAVSESEEQAAQRMQFLKQVGGEMGVAIRDIGPEFVKLAASITDTKIAGQEEGIFKSFMQYGTVMGLDPEAMKGSFRAVSQMINKQQVYAEELKGQLTN